ncbi:MAG: sensor histidine kinase [Desulfobacterales bacterium]
MKISHFVSLRTRLYILILITALPGWALSIYNASEQKRNSVHIIHQNALRTVRLAAAQEARVLEEAQQLLMTMADFFMESHGDSIKFCSFIHRTLNRTVGYANFGAVRPDGELICSVHPVPKETNLAQRHWFVRAKEFRDFAIGEYHLGYDQKAPALFLAQPVLDQKEQLLAVLFAALDINGLDRMVVGVLTDLPQGAIIIQIDQEGDSLCYDPASARWSQRTDIDADIIKTVLSRKSGFLEAASIDGISRIYAFSPMAGPLKKNQIILVTSMPSKIAFAAANRTLALNLSLLGAATLLALLFVWKGSEVFILRRVRAMTAASRRLAGGDLTARIGPVEGKDELSQLAQAFDEMAVALEILHEVEQQAAEKIRQSREQLRHLTSHLQKVREEERTRIARELHDQFGQTLTVLKMDLAWLAKHLPGPKRSLQVKLDAMGAVIDATLQVLHRVCTELRPVILDDFGLAAAIQWQTEDFQGRTGIACSVILDTEAEKLSQDESTALFRIFQETLTNVLRHAAATEIGVHLWEEENQLKLEIADNGKGIAETEISSPTSLGLIGIRERVYGINGSIQFSGIRGKGTRVTVAVPLNGKTVPHA